MKRWTGIMIFLLLVKQLSAQEKLPLKEQFTSTDKPFIFLVSGDGGVKGFTAWLCSTMHDKGYSIASLDAHAYFWNKKTPEQTASDITNYLTTALRSRADHHWVMIGYSFGADVLPALANRLPRDLRDRLDLVVFLGLSDYAAFEFHLTDWIDDEPSKRDQPVRPELEKLSGVNRLCIYGEEEQDAACPQLADLGILAEKAPGDHHFDEDYPGVARRILDRLSPSPQVVMQPPAKN